MYNQYPTNLIILGVSVATCIWLAIVGIRSNSNRPRPVMHVHINWESQYSASIVCVDWDGQEIDSLCNELVVPHYNEDKSRKFGDFKQSLWEEVKKWCQPKNDFSVELDLKATEIAEGTKISIFKITKHVAYNDDITPYLENSQLLLNGIIKIHG